MYNERSYINFWSSEEVVEPDESEQIFHQPVQESEEENRNREEFELFPNDEPQIREEKSASSSLLSLSYEIRSKYRTMSTKSKRMIVKKSEKGITKVAKKYGISTSCIARWRIRCRRKRRSTHGKYPAMEEKLVKFLQICPKLTNDQIKRKAKEYQPSESFKATNGWLYKFFNRNKKQLPEILLIPKRNRFAREQMKQK